MEKILKILTSLILGAFISFSALAKTSSDDYSPSSQTVPVCLITVGHELVNGNAFSGSRNYIQSDRVETHLYFGKVVIQIVNPNLRYAVDILTALKEQ